MKGDRGNAEERKRGKNERSAGEGGEEVAEFVVDVGVAGDGVGDFVAEELAVALTEAVQGDADGGFAHGKSGGEFGVGSVGAAAGEVGAEGVEERGAFGGGVFVAQTARDGGEERERPSAVEGAVGREIGGGRLGEGGFGGGGVERSEEVGAAFFGAGVIAEVGEVVIKTAEEEGSEAAARALDGGEGFEAEESGEETLDGVLGVGGRERVAAGVGVERLPIRVAELGEGFGGLRGGGVAGGEDDGPAGGGEGGAHLT